jgi:hypothetical protein
MHLFHHPTAAATLEAAVQSCAIAAHIINITIGLANIVQQVLRLLCTQALQHCLVQRLVRLQGECPGMDPVTLMACWCRDHGAAPAKSN